MQAVKIDLVTLFPEICHGPLSESIMKRAQEKGIVELHIHNLRDWTTDKHHIVDDAPFGGGQGMVMKPEPIFAAVEDLKQQTPNSDKSRAGAQRPTSDVQLQRPKVILMSPAGRRFDQEMAGQLSGESHLIVVCGHYEGVDHRVIEHLVDLEISIGDYVLTNGANNPQLMIASAPKAPDSKPHSTCGPPSFVVGKSRKFCFPEITLRSQSGAKNRRSSVRARIGRTYWQINFAVSSRTAKTVRDLAIAVRIFW